MLLNLSLKDKIKGKSKWFEFDEDVKFKLRYVSPEDLRSSRSKYMTTKVRGGIRQEEMSSQNEKKFDIDLWDMMIDDWVGIVVEDENGKLIKAECSKENKKELDNFAPQHARFILDTATDLSNFVDIEKEEGEIKNSQTSSPSK